MALDLSPTDLEYLKKRGINPEDVVEAPSDTMSGGRAALATLKGHGGGIVGGGAGALGATAAASWLLGPEVGLPVTIGAGVIGALGGGYAGQKVQEGVLSDDTNQRLAREASQAEEQHPIISTGTDVAASALASGGAFSPRTLLRAGRGIIGKAALSEADQIAMSQIGREALSPEGAQVVARRAGDVNALKNVAVQATLNPAIDTGVSLATGQGIPSPRRLIADAAGGALFSQPSWIGKKYGGMHEVKDEPLPEPNVKGLENVKLENMPSELVEKGDLTQPLKMKEKKPVVVKDEVVPPVVEKKINLIPTTEEQAALQKELVDSGQVGTMVKEGGFPRQEYSPDDLQRYNNLSDQMIPKSKEQLDSPEYQQTWKEFETLRNKYGGMPPKQLEKSPVASTDQPLTEARILTPLPLTQHIKSGTATTGSVLKTIGDLVDYPFAPIAKHLHSIADEESLKVPWSSNVEESRSHYNLNTDRISLNPSDLGNARVLMEEAIHSITSKKLDLFRGARGAELKNRMDTYLQRGDNEAVKDLIKSYQSVVDKLGMGDLFKDSPSEISNTKGAAGVPDEVAEIAARQGNRNIGYAIGDLHEFLAQSFKNEQFQRLLNEMPSDIQGKSMWQRVVDAVRRLLGFDVKQGSMLESVLKTGSEIASQERPNTKIEPSVEGQRYPNSDTVGAMPKDDSRKGFLRPLEATFDKVDRDSTVIGEAGRRWEKRKDQFLGMRNVTISDLEQFPRDAVDKVNAMRREAFRSGSVPRFTSEQQKINDVLQSYYGKIADIRRDVGLKIDSRTAGKSEYYSPDQLNDKTLDLFVNHPLSPEAIYAEDKWVDHVFKESGGTWTKDGIRSDIQSYIAALGGENNNYNSVKFGAIRKAQGYGLPEGLRETDAINSLHKYGGRAASDLAMFMELESKPIVAASLMLKDPNTGKLVTHPSSDSRLAASPRVKDMMKWVTNGFAGTMSQSMPKTTALIRLINNSILGTGTGLRDTVQMPAMAIPYINKFSDLSAAMKGILNYRNESRNALATAAKKPSIDKLQFGSILESPDAFSALLNKGATVMRKYQGREAIENFNRDVTFSIGKELAKSNIIGAKGGDKQSLAFLKKFGTLVDVDPVRVEGAEREKVLNQMAKNFTDRNQGTYGGSGLPAGIIESQFAPFFALQKWSVEKSNVIYQDVVKPFITGENRLPMITYTLGSVLTGVAIQKLNELLSNRKGQDPTVTEALDKGDLKTITGELATLMQLSSLGGIVGDGMKFASDIGLYGKTPRNIVSFPTATAALDFQDKITDVIEALKNDENPWEVWKMFTLDMLSHNIQTARLALNHTAKAEDVKRTDKFRDLQVFNQMEGRPAAEIPKTNQYLGIEQKEFKRSDNVEDAVKLLPGILKKAIADADGDPYKLMAKLRSLKSNSYQTMPNFDTLRMQFVKYIQQLQRTQGEDVAADRLRDYLTQNAVNRVKSAVVP